MELSKKTTILFSPEEHERLTRLAAARGMSLGEIVREACAKQYVVTGASERLEAVHGLARLFLPVGSTAAMKRESVVDPAALLPE